MIKPFNLFILEEKVKKVAPSKETAAELLASAKVFLKMCESAPLTEELASPILVNAYEAAREAGQSLMAKCGYKPYSHEAVIAFLAESARFSAIIINKLDSLRVLRNNVAYAAEKVAADDAKRAIELAKEIIMQVGETQNEN